MNAGMIPAISHVPDNAPIINKMMMASVVLVMVAMVKVMRKVAVKQFS